jgi:hypothetical protein
MQTLFLPFRLPNGTERKDPRTRLPQETLVGNYHTNHSYSQTFQDMYSPRTKTIEGISGSPQPRVKRTRMGQSSISHLSDTEGFCTTESTLDLRFKLAEVEGDWWSRGGAPCFVHLHSSDLETICQQWMWKICFHIGRTWPPNTAKSQMIIWRRASPGL